MRLHVLRPRGNEAACTFVFAHTCCAEGFYVWYACDAEIQNAFPTFVCGAYSLQIRRLLLETGRLYPRIGRFLLKMQKATSDEHWLYAIM